jgi:hypothetical protein
MSTLWDLLGVPPPTEEDLLLTEIPIISSDEQQGESMESLGLRLSEVVVNTAFRPAPVASNEDLYTIRGISGPERPNVYNDIGLFKQHMNVMYRMLKTAFASDNRKFSQALRRMQHVYERYGLVPFKPLARYTRGRDYFSFFCYYPVQQKLTEVKMGIDRKILFNLPREYLGDIPRYLSLLKPIFRPRVFPARILFHRRRFMTTKLRHLKSYHSVIWLYNSDVRVRHELKNVVVPYPNSNEVTGIIREVDYKRQFLYEDERPKRSKFSHEVFDLPIGSVGLGSATLKDAANPESDLRPFGLPIETEFQHLLVPEAQHPVPQPNLPTHTMLGIKGSIPIRKDPIQVTAGYDCSLASGSRSCKPWNPCPAHS